MKALQVLADDVYQLAHVIDLPAKLLDREAPAEIKQLYEDAAGQNPDGGPFLIFIDVNFPLTPDVLLMQKEWVNFSREEAAPPGENCQARVERPKYPLRNTTWDLLGRALAEYGRLVDEEERTG
jgi:hypothetical protein